MVRARKHEYGIYKMMPPRPMLRPVSRPSTSCLTRARSWSTTASRERSRPEREPTRGVRKERRDARISVSKTFNLNPRRKRELTKAKSGDDVVQRA